MIVVDRLRDSIHVVPGRQLDVHDRRHHVVIQNYRLFIRDKSVPGLSAEFERGGISSRASIRVNERSDHAVAPARSRADDLGKTVLLCEIRQCISARVRRSAGHDVEIVLSAVAVLVVNYAVKVGIHMIPLISVASCQHIFAGEVYLSVLREESENGDQAGCRAAAVIGNVNDHILNFIMLLYILEAVIEESEVADLLILFGDWRQIIGRISFCRVIHKLGKVDHRCIAGVIKSLLSVIRRHAAHHIE